MLSLWTKKHMSFQCREQRNDNKSKNEKVKKALIEKMTMIWYYVCLQWRLKKKM